jgi:hypothetical protein
VREVLERRLEALGGALEVPAAPDVIPAVLARLPARRHQNAFRRPGALGFAVALMLAGGAMAVPETRHAILRGLGLRGVRVERVPRLPRTPREPLPLGRRVSLVAARRAASFTAPVPAGASAAYVSRDVPGGRVSYVVGNMLVIEFRGRSTPFVMKLAGPGTLISRLRIDRQPAVYISGSPHVVLFQVRDGNVESDFVRRAGDVLIWQRGPLTIRIEGSRSLAQALALVRSLR